MGHYYYDDSITSSERQFFFDDGKTVNSVEKGDYQILEFEAETKGNWLEVEKGSIYSSETKSVELAIHNLNEEPKRINTNGQKVLLKSWNEKTKSLGLILIL